MTILSPRILALDPTTRGFAYVLLEGAEQLRDWGSVNLLVRTDANILARVARVIDRSQPDFLVVEDGRGTRRRPRATRIIRGIEDLAKERSIPVIRVSRSHVRREFAPAKTKQEIALTIAQLFPELRPRLPRPRTRPYMSEDERMNLFDAASFALAALARVTD